MNKHNWKRWLWQWKLACEKNINTTKSPMSHTKKIHHANSTDRTYFTCLFSSEKVPVFVSEQKPHIMESDDTPSILVQDKLPNILSSKHPGQALWK